MASVSVFLQVVEVSHGGGDPNAFSLEVVRNFLGEATVAVAYTRPVGDPRSLSWQECTAEETESIDGYVKFPVPGFGAVVRQRNSAWLFVLDRNAVALALPLADTSRPDARLQLVAINALSVTGLIAEAFDFPVEFADKFRAAPGGSYYLHRDGSGWNGKAALVAPGKPVPDFRLEFAASIINPVGDKPTTAVKLRPPTRRLNSTGDPSPGAKAFVRLGCCSLVQDSDEAAITPRPPPGGWAWRWAPSKAFFGTSTGTGGNPAPKRAADESGRPAGPMPKRRPRLELSQAFIESATLPESFAELLGVA